MKYNNYPEKYLKPEFVYLTLCIQKSNYDIV